MKSTIRQLLRAKGSEVWYIKPEATVYEALEFMAEKDIGALPVLDRFNSLTGIFSERDYARKVVLKGKSSKETTVREMMTSEVLCVWPDTTIEDCMGLITAKRVRHLPVLENNRVIGIITIGDVVNKVISTQNFTINEMEKYITGNAFAT